ncbi:hypothetical protein BC936DRAFT_141214 [Jimgerdemannia flammicorona]|uniref:Uncharacterized protein n=1 Tax=Jimgerdemannia flammicorona TaxID=994334 RepID=A0A433DGF2_9FUNG|nr:hypothetical protein BC936DRAFT_141214 [Jimgerdemannia flammicorona]
MQRMSMDVEAAPIPKDEKSGTYSALSKNIPQTIASGIDHPWSLTTDSLATIEGIFSVLRLRGGGCVKDCLIAICCCCAIEEVSIRSFLRLLFPAILHPLILCSRTTLPSPTFQICCCAAIDEVCC